MQPSNHNPSLLGFFLQFLSKPKYPSHLIAKSFKEKLTDVWQLYALNIVIICLVTIPLSILAAPFVSYKSHAISELSTFELFFEGVLLGPFSEEIIFRLFLRYSLNNILFSSSLISLLICGLLIKPFGNYAIFIIFLSPLSYLLCKKYLSQKSANNFYAKNIGWMLYLSTVIFALVHLDNYNELKGSWLILPVLVAPQFIIGLSLGLIRINYGFKWSVFFHAFYNLIAILAGYLISLKNSGINLATFLVYLLIFLFCLKETYSLVRVWRRNRQRD